SKGRASADIWQMAYPSGELQKLTEDLNNYLAISLATDGKVIAVESKLASQVLVSPNPDGSRSNSVASGWGKVAWTADDRIVYESATRSSSDLWIAKADGTEPKQLTFNSGFNSWPAISPDGRTMVFQSDRSGTQHLWRMDLDGSNPLQL